MDIAINPELIRTTALGILAQKKEGIKQSELFKTTEARLADKYVIPPHAIKNALWDLADRFSQYVIKKKASYREVWLYPTESLLNSVNASLAKNGDSSPFILAENREEYKVTSKSQKEREMSKELNQRLLLQKVADIYRYVEFSDILALLADLQLNHLGDMTPGELEMFFRVKATMKDLRKIRNEMVHSDGISGFQ